MKTGGFSRSANRLTISSVTPPEIILDRWIKRQSREHPRLAGYVGKLDIGKLDSEALESLLNLIQQGMNRALEVGRTSVPGGDSHPPFHFDYVEVNDGTRNAHAFQHDGFSFIVVTLPLVELLWDLSEKLAASPLVRQFAQLGSREVRWDGFRALLFQFQLSFLISHEHTHHIHGHPGVDARGTQLRWNEFEENELSGGLESQAQEIDADGFAIFTALAHYIRGAGRKSLIAQLGIEDLPSAQVDELLLTCFILALTAFFCAMWRDELEVESIRQLRHPPAPVRIEYAKRVARMWCSENGFVSDPWSSDERFQRLFSAALEAFGGTTRPSWDAHIAFLQSEEGAKYDQELLKRFDEIRMKAEEPIPVL
ncbi:MAG: hypothetical protein WA609_02025 [Terriglobales bacterium]